MKKKEILFLAVATFIVVVAWIGFELYHKWVSTTVSEDLQMQIIPIDPTFDAATLEKLKKRESVAPEYELNSSKSSVTPSPTLGSQGNALSSEENVSVTVTASPSPSLSPSP